MIKKLLPVILLIFGAGAGVGAGLFLRPAPAPEAAEAADGATDEAPEEAAEKKEEKPEEKGEEKAEEKAEEGAEEGVLASEYVKMNNQFVIPVVEQDDVVALVVVSLSVEVDAGQKDTVYRHEPKLRDSFLQVLFNHSNRGGFDGAFTRPQTMADLRNALLEVAQRDVGNLAKDVLILGIARQDI